MANREFGKPDLAQRAFRVLFLLTVGAVLGSWGSWYLVREDFLGWEEILRIVSATVSAVLLVALFYKGKDERRRRRLTETVNKRIA